MEIPTSNHRIDTDEGTTCCERTRLGHGDLIESDMTSHRTNPRQDHWIDTSVLVSNVSRTYQKYQECIKKISNVSRKTVKKYSYRSDFLVWKQVVNKNLDPNCTQVMAISWINPFPGPEFSFPWQAFRTICPLF